MSPSNPVRLFAEVKLNSSPVMDARVTATLRALNQSGHLSQPIEVDLLDTGSGGKFEFHAYYVLVHAESKGEKEGRP